MSIFDGWMLYEASEEPFFHLCAERFCDCNLSPEVRAKEYDALYAITKLRNL